MPVFKTFFKIAAKHIKSSIIYLAIFLFVGVMYSQVGDGSEKEYQLSSCDIAVFDRDNSSESARLIEYMGQIHNIITDYEDDKEMLQDRLFYRDISYVLYIEKGFSKTGKLSNIKRQDTNVGAYIDGQIESYQSTYAAAKQAGYSDDEAYELTMESLDGSELVRLYGKEANKYGNGIFYYFQFECFVIVMVILTVMGPIFMAFNRKEAKDRLEVSSMPPRRRMLELFAGALALSLIAWVFVSVACVIVNNGVFGRKELLGTLNALIFTIVSAALCCIAGNVSISSNAFNMMSNVIGLAMAFLGGVFVPLQFFGKTLGNIAKLLPTYWYVMANEGIFGEKATGEIIMYFGIELLFAAAFFGIALVMSKRRRLAKSA